MAQKQIIDDNIWMDRINSADRYYKQWEALFKCKILEQYYEGVMWKSQRELGYNPYVINKFFDNIADRFEYGTYDRGKCGTCCVL